jgi:hypothetical protein
MKASDVYSGASPVPYDQDHPKRDRGWHCLFRRGAFLTARSPPLDRLCRRYANEGRQLHSTEVDPPELLVEPPSPSVAALRRPVSASDTGAELLTLASSGCSFCLKAGAGDGIPRGSFFSRSKTPRRAIVPGAVLALVDITQATKHPCAPVTVRGEMRRLGFSKPIQHDCLLWKLGWVVAPSPGKLLEKHCETTARGACPVALHSRHTFTSAFAKVFYPRVRDRHTFVRCELTSGGVLSYQGRTPALRPGLQGWIRA